jgi:hypothetical protein
MSGLLLFLLLFAQGPEPAPLLLDPTPTGHVVLEPYVARLVTVDAVAGSDTLRLLFDSGGGATLLTPDAAARLGCEPAGFSTGFRMDGERITWELCEPAPEILVGGIAAPTPVGVFDLMGLLPEGLPSLDGLASLETFAGHRVTLDLAGRSLRVESGHAPPPADAVAVPARIATGTDGDELTVFLRLRAGERTGWFLVDSANLAGVRIAPHMLPPDAPETGSVGIDLGGGLTAEAAYERADLLYDGALSEAVLREWVLVLDLAEGNAWVREAGDR